MTSLRVRLFAGILAGVTLFLAASGVLIYFLVRERMVGETDRALTTVARTLRSSVNLELGRRVREGFPPRGELRLPDSVLRLDVLFQIRMGDGPALAKSDRLGEA